MRKFAADERAGQRRRSEAPAEDCANELSARAAPHRSEPEEVTFWVCMMLATAALSFHNPRAEREFELEEEFELTGAAAQSAFLQTQSRGADPPGMDCICESMKCNCAKPCACGEPTFNLDTNSIEIDGGCYCNKLECDCQKRCSCYTADTLPPPPPFPPPAAAAAAAVAAAAIPAAAGVRPCGCAGDYAGLSSGWIRCRGRTATL